MMRGEFNRKLELVGKKEYNPKAYSIVKVKIKDNPDLQDYKYYIKYIKED